MNSLNDQQNVNNISDFMTRMYSAPKKNPDVCMLTS